MGEPGVSSYPSDMTTRPSGDRYRLWPAARPYVRMLVLSALPVPDLPSRHKVRRTARSLVKCDPWPGMEATGADAAQLALLRLLHLQKATRRAVRSRQDEAATMLARVAIETLITGLYCIHEPTAPGRLQGEALRQLMPMLQFMVDAGLLTADVLADSVQRLGLGAPAKGPGIEEMARVVDRAGASIAAGLYNRFYRPTSNLAIHAGAASLLRHVRGGGRVSGRPSRVWGRRSPVRIADACVGALTAVLANRSGTPCQHAVQYADRHFERAVAPVIAISLGGLGRGLRPGQVLAAVGRVRAFGEYVRSGEDAGDPVARTARIRAEMEGLLMLPGLDIPADALAPYLDFIAEKIASETAVAAAGAGSALVLQWLRRLNPAARPELVMPSGRARWKWASARSLGTIDPDAREAGSASRA